MSFLQSITNLFSSDARAMAVYKRGMKKAKRDDWSGAIQDYTVVVDSHEAPSNVKAMAYFNRALAYSHQKDYAKAVEDLDAVLAIPEAPSNVANAARQKQAHWKKRHER